MTKKTELYKECACCFLMLPESEFYIDNAKVAKLASYCKDCHRDYNREHMRGVRAVARGR